MRITRAQLRPAIEHLVVCGVALFIVCAVLPVPTLGFELPKFVALTAGATLAALILIFSKQPVLSFVLRNRIGMAFAMFMGVIVLSLLWSVAPIASLLGVAPRFHGVLTYVALGTLALMAMVLASQNKGLALLRRGVLTINIVVVLYGLLQMLALDPLGHLWQSEAFLGRTFSLLGHPNALAQCIVLTLPFVGLAWSRTEERVERLWWLMLVVLNCTVLFATASRSGLLGLLLLGLLCSSKLKVYLRTQRDRIKPEQAFALSLIVVLCCSIGFVFFTQRFASSFETGRSSSARVEIWETMLEMFGDRPIGWGLETLSFTSPRFLTKNIYAYESLTAVIDRAHNELMQLLVTAGPLALVSYVWLIVLLLHTAWRERKYDETGMIRASASAIAAFQVTLLFGFPTIATSFVFWSLVGMAIALLPGKEVAVKTMYEHIARFALAAICVSALVVSLQWLQARWVHAYARLLWSEDPGVALAAHQEALLTFGYDRESIIEAAEAHVIVAEQAEDKEPLLHSVEIMADMLHTVSGGEDGMEYILRAWVYGLRGDAGSVKTALLEAKKYYRNSIVYHRAAAYIYRLVGEGTAAYENESAIRALLPDAYFEAGSETRRILQKQHPWLESL